MDETLCGIPRPPYAPERLCSLPFRGSEAVRAGLLTRDQLKSGCWRRLLPNVYVHNSVEVTHCLQCRAAALVLPTASAISGPSAAYLFGADVLARGESLEVTVPPHMWMTSKPGMAVHHSRLSAIDIIRHGGVPVTAPVRTVFDLARWREPEDEAIVAVDAVLTRCRLTVEQIRAYATAHPYARLGGKVARVLDLAVPGADSPMETRLRLLLVRAGLPLPALQYEVRDPAGPFVARLDLAYPEAHLGIEYDGGDHFDPERVRKDLLRQNALRASGWSLLRFVYDDVMRYPSRLLAQVCSALHG